MKRLLLAAIITFSFIQIALAQDSIKEYKIEEAVILGRKLSDIGITKTELDTVILRDNLSNSFAEILSQNTPIFIKSYGRATMASASFRGTAPSHTQVTWNDIKLNSPMLGMVDFSQIPSYFIDDATLYHGAGSVGVSGGGLGGAIALGTKAPIQQGIGISFIQGIGGFNTFDEFLRVTYGSQKFRSSTRAYYATSDNDFKYVNYEKIDNPTERNKSGDFKDLHVLQEFYYSPNQKDKFELAAWYMNSDRGVPLLNTDYGEDNSRSEQLEQTFRTVGEWSRYVGKLKLGAKLGYVFSNMKFHNWEDNGGSLGETINAESEVNTGFAKLDADYYIAKQLSLSFNISAHLHSVSSREHQIVGGKPWDKSRLEVSALLTAKYRPHPRFSVGLDLREDRYGSSFTPLIPAGFMDYVMLPKYNLIIKTSVAKNYRYPTLNDLYFLPGGNPDLKAERGFTYDGGVEFGIKKDSFTLTGEATAYSSNIYDWILWLPTHKGFWTPINIKRVHSYGVELKGKLNVDFGKDWSLYIDANWACTRSINKDDPKTENDESVGKQLVYVPVYSNGVTGKLRWKRYILTYKYNYYSKRFGTTSNEPSKLYSVHSYYMNDASIERSFSFSFADMSLKLTVNNLFNEAYLSVLSRPMAGRSYEVFIRISPKWKKKNP
ncbi:MAG: TonB-dependent receptor [Prevotellaceae bacterium]|jgi:iron complex outermembrane receptor protein|nr:TonB-dependent receptor [Prevotellaceae bacterium]